MAYLIVSGESLEALVGIVNEKELSGWKATGGPFVVNKKSLWLERPEEDKGKLVAQALIKIDSSCECISREEPPC